MGRTPLSGWPLLHRLRKEGHSTSTFGYSAAFEDFTSIRDRLVRRMVDRAGRGPYALIGHSLGGVLLRSALDNLPMGTPRPTHLFLLGSPIRPARLARQLRNRCLFRLLTGDCGRLLASSCRMNAIGGRGIPTTSILGTRGLSSGHSPFGDEPNDGVVAASEAQAPWVVDQVDVPVIHTLLPASRAVGGILLERLRGT